MKTIKTDEEMQRHKYITQEAPVLLGQILNGTLAGGRVADPVVCANLAYEAAGALYDQLIVERVR